MAFKGIKELEKQFKKLEDFADQIGGRIGSYEFDPWDPTSIGSAIQKMCDDIDNSVPANSNNQLAVVMGEQLKEMGRQAILDRAESDRLERG